jgi:hypothetical protein
MAGTPNTGAAFMTNGTGWFRQGGFPNKDDFFSHGGLSGLDLYVLIRRMTDRPASWRKPTPKQMEKLGAEAVRKAASRAAAPDPELPAEYWDAVLRDPQFCLVLECLTYRVMGQPLISRIELTVGIYRAFS